MLQTYLKRQQDVKNCTINIEGTKITVEPFGSRNG